MRNLLYLLVIAVMFSCSGNSSKNKSEGTTEIKKETPVIEQAEDLSDHPGEPVYMQHCLPCHQADGNGVPGMYPPLQDTKWVNGDNATLIGIVLHGMDEEIEVKGESFNTIMAPLPHLTDQEVMDVLNYVRKRFGSSDEKITLEQVKQVRDNG